MPKVTMADIYRHTAAKQTIDKYVTLEQKAELEVRLYKILQDKLLKVEAKELVQPEEVELLVGISSLLVKSEVSFKVESLNHSINVARAELERLEHTTAE